MNLLSICTVFPKNFRNISDVSGFGGIMFILMLFALVLSVTSFAGSNWSNRELEDGSRDELGLWEACECTKDELPDKGE